MVTMQQYEALKEALEALEMGYPSIALCALMDEGISVHFDSFAKLDVDAKFKRSASIVWREPLKNKFRVSFEHGESAFAALTSVVRRIYTEATVYGEAQTQ